MTTEQKYYLKVCLWCYLVWLVLFEAVGTYAARLPTSDITTAFDARIPLIPQFVWVYHLTYLMPILPVVLVLDWHRLNRAIIAFTIASLSAFLVYLAYPVAFPRPGLGLSLSERILGFEYALDFQPGANKLPSLHVAFAWIILAACWRQRLNRIGDAALVAFVILITVSTVFVKQHVVADVAAGLLWAAGSWSIAAIVYPKISSPTLSGIEALKATRVTLAPLFLTFGAMAIGIAALRYGGAS